MSTTYILTAATFKSTSITSVTSATIAESANATPISTDGSRNVNLVVVDGKTVTITVESTNQANGAVANFRVGQAGALVLTTVLRTAGDGISTTAILTINEAVLISNTTNSPTAGAGTHSMTFQAYDADNNGLLAWT